MESFFIFTLWWLELHTITAMVDYQSISEGWLGEATLFPAEHNDYENLDLDDFFSPQKDIIDGTVIDPWSGLEWLEQEIKINITDEPNSFSILPNESAIDECLKFFPELLQDSGALNLTPEDIKPEIKNFYEPNSYVPLSPVSQSFSPSYESISEAGSPEADSGALNLPPDDIKPEIKSISGSNSYAPLSPVSQSISLSYESISEAGSPESYISDIGADSTIYDLGLSDSGSPDSPSVVSVSICRNEEVGSDPPVRMTIEEVASLVKERKYLNAGDNGKVPKVRVTLKDPFQPYSRSKSGGSKRKRASDPAERKKKQNKEAAARYRMKRRSEEMEISDELNKLEEEKVGLQAKVDNMLSEIKYLKKLMLEIHEKRGLI